MNLTARPASHTASQPASRLTGISLAIGIHVVLILAFASAFVKPHLEPKPTTPQVVLKDPAPKPPEPQPRWEPKFTTTASPETPRMDPLPWELAKEPTATPFRDDGPKTTATGPTGPVTLAPPMAPPAPNVLPKAGAVCSHMEAPVMPNVNFAGEALFRAVATTQGGRVTAVEIQALRSGIDSRSLRAFKSAIESALSGYQCQGDVRFTQEFNFRLE